MAGIGNGWSLAAGSLGAGLNDFVKGFFAAFSARRCFSSSGNSLYCSHFSLIASLRSGGAVFMFLYWTRA